MNLSQKLADSIRSTISGAIARTVADVKKTATEYEKAQREVELARDAWLNCTDTEERDKLYADMEYKRGIAQYHEISHWYALGAKASLETLLIYVQINIDVHNHVYGEAETNNAI